MRLAALYPEFAPPSRGRRSRMGFLDSFPENPNPDPWEGESGPAPTGWEQDPASGSWTGPAQSGEDLLSQYENDDAPAADDGGMFGDFGDMLSRLPQQLPGQLPQQLPGTQPQPAPQPGTTTATAPAKKSFPMGLLLIGGAIIGGAYLLGSK